ncbi:MAG: hypothetical protein WAN12_15645 [Candidatus Acidiferrum sp.]
MDPEWQRVFRDRMHRFEVRPSARPGDIAVSIKIRVVSGCFHREHSPRAYDAIDSQLVKLSHRPELGFEEHESGPELLVYLAVATAGITLAKSVIDLVTAIIKARADGVEKGDKPADPLELIVRRVDKGDEFHEKIVLRIGHKDLVDAKMIKKQLDQAFRKLLKKNDATEGARRKRSPRS